MKMEVLADAEAAARRSATIIADEARRAVQTRGQFLLATSGGRTPWRMLELLAELPVPWSRVHLFQVDERVVPAASAARNLHGLRASLLERVSLPPSHVHAMPVDNAELDAAAEQYAHTLQRVAGAPPTLDLVHLGLGADGHTASLSAGSPALDVTDRDVTATSLLQGFRRMTITYPLINRARLILWLVTGSEKAAALAQLRAGGRDIPAGRVRRAGALIVADEAAVGSDAGIESGQT